MDTITILLGIAGIFATLLGFVGIMFIYWATSKIKDRALIKDSEKGVKFIKKSFKWLVGLAVILIGVLLLTTVSYMSDWSEIFTIVVIFLIIGWLVLMSLFFIGIYENLIVKPKKDAIERHKRMNP